MTMHHACPLFLALLLLLLPCAALADEPAPDDARAAAETWLRLIDGGEYDRCWDQASPIMKQNMPHADWRRALAEGAAQLGPLSARRLERSKLDRDPPHGPTGRYALFRFDAIYQDTTLHETLALRLEDGTWRVVAYWLE
ncbi:MAG: DUF4019 domain-containing protein [Pseudodesulfovibrio sp.]